MPASQINQEIGNLLPEEQAEVVRFAYRLDAERQLTGAELSALAERMVNSTDPAQITMLRGEIMRGFYGEKRHAWSSPREPSARSASTFARPRSAAQHLGQPAWDVREPAQPAAQGAGRE